MSKIVDYIKQYIGVMSMVLAVCILLTYSLSYFKVNTQSKRAAEMYIGELKYTISIDGTSTNTLTVPAGETIVDIDLTNQNEIKTYYKLLYLKNANISISYYNQTKNTSDIVTSYKAPSDAVESKSQNNLKLKIINNSSSNQTLTFKVSGGYSTNTLADVEVPNTYSEITTIEIPSTNTYFCKTDDTLTQGLEYVDGQYTYRYKQEGKYVSSGIGWNNTLKDGWGIQLTDKTSTDAVTSKICTYVNNKPIISMNWMFSGSQATTIDLSNFDTSNVIYMAHMFQSSQATTLDVSSFDTSKVTDMSCMFSNTKAIELNLSNFDTSKVTDMGSMFSISQATTIDLSNFDTSNVTYMSNMFDHSRATTLDVSNFDTSKVTNMSSMFFNSEATTLDLSNFDTSNVTNMANMFQFNQATTLDLSNFDTSKVTNMNYMFREINVATLDLSSFDTSKVTEMEQMFYYCKNLKTIYVSNKFVTTNVTTSTNMFIYDSNLVGGSGTKYNSSYIDKTYARIDGGTSSPGYFTDAVDKNIPDPSSFSTDSWKTIIKAVRNNNTSKYNVGDTKSVSVGSYGTHTLRIANKSTPSSCSSTGFSQSACGFVLEFVDIVDDKQMNETSDSSGGWPISKGMVYVNNIYNALPEDLKSGILSTYTVSGHPLGDRTSIESTDKLYLLAPGEIYKDWSDTNDSSHSKTRQLDYYSNNNVTTSSYSLARKKSGSTYTEWWLRSATFEDANSFYIVYSSGSSGIEYAIEVLGLSPAFRIG